MRRAVLRAVLCLALVPLAALPARGDEKTPPTPEQTQATAAIGEYFRRTTARLADRALGDVATLDDWQQTRPRLRQQILDMLGLWPLPEKTDLHATVTGTVEGDGFIVEKLHFQSMPGLYVTANFYRPKEVDGPLPTILYLCGHGQVKIDGVSYGNKTSYQHHPAWFAREGYCCLIIDTLQLGEIEGIHHGTYREGMWWWIARGYTPAGVEAWNAVRAIDYLETRPEVDAKRIGVTGRSGGGAYSWWSAAIDERPACFVPVAGITDLQNHVVDGCIEGHCDCMFMVNTYGWDFAMVAALAAPRPLLFSNSDKDKIFPLDGVVRTHARLRKIYELYGAADRLGLLITEGPHKDTQELQVPAFRWFNRWLQKKDEPIRRVADKPFDVKQLRVFTELPRDERNTSIQETFVPKAEPPEPPSQRAQWETLRERWLHELAERSFRGWPASPPALDVRCVAQQEAAGLRLRVLDYTSDENLRLPILLIDGAQGKTSDLAVVVADSEAWHAWRAALAPRFAAVLPGGGADPDDAAFAALAQRIQGTGSAVAIVAPRGSGPNEWDPRKATQIRRRFVLLGKTEDDGRVWDVRRAIQTLVALDGLGTARVSIEGKGRAAGIALYAGLFEPRVARFELDNPPVTHRDGPIFLNVLRVLDMPQAVALALPRPVVLCGSDAKAWRWPAAVARLYDSNHPPVEVRESPANAE